MHTIQCFCSQKVTVCVSFGITWDPDGTVKLPTMQRTIRHLVRPCSTHLWPQANVQKQEPRWYHKEVSHSYFFPLAAWNECQSKCVLMSSRRASAVIYSQTAAGNGAEIDREGMRVDEQLSSYIIYPSDRSPKLKHTLHALIAYTQDKQ